MSIESVVEGLVECIEGVPGIAAVFDYEPRQVDISPCAYILLDSFQQNIKGGVRVSSYRFLVRVLVRWQDNEYAEREARPFVNSVPKAIEADSSLQGRLHSGGAFVDQGDNPVQFVTIGGVEMRSIDIYVRVVEKTARDDE